MSIFPQLHRLIISNNCDGQNCALYEEPFLEDLFVSDQDYFSNLPYDCMQVIFQYFESKDLNVITTVNQKLHSVAELFRKEEEKSYTNASKDTLTLRQERSGIFLVHTHTYTENGEKGYYSFCDRKKIVHEGIHIPWQNLSPNMKEIDNSEYYSTPCHAFHRIRLLLKRFKFYEIRFESVLIDNSFIDHCKHVFTGQSPHKCVFKNSMFPKDSNLEHLKRFTAFAHSLKPNILSLLDKSNFSKDIAKDFLRSFVSIDRSVSISAKYKIDINLLDADIFDMFKSLTEYKSFDLSNLIVDADCLLMLIQARSRLNLEGEFRFSTTRNMERDEIASSLDDDMKYIYHLTRDDNKHRLINVDGNPASRVLIEIDSANEPCKVFVHFGKSAFTIKI